MVELDQFKTTLNTYKEGGAGTSPRINQRRTGWFPAPPESVPLHQGRQVPLPAQEAVP